MTVKIVITLATLAVFAGSAQATTLVMPDGAAKTLYGQWLVESAIPTANTSVQVVSSNCDQYGVMACTDTFHHPFRVFYPDISYLAQPGYSARDLLMAHLNFMHEMGHVLDFTLNGRGPHRQRYRLIFRHILGASPREDWEVGDHTLFEKFAMAYAYCSVFPDAIPPHVIHDVYWGFDYYPTPSQHGRVCRMFAADLG